MNIIAVICWKDKNKENKKRGRERAIKKNKDYD